MGPAQFSVTQHMEGENGKVPAQMGYPIGKLQNLSGALRKVSGVIIFGDALFGDIVMPITRARGALVGESLDGASQSPKIVDPTQFEGVGHHCIRGRKFMPAFLSLWAMCALRALLFRGRLILFGPAWQVGIN